jgi:hypothetical protein
MEMPEINPIINISGLDSDIVEGGVKKVARHDTVKERTFDFEEEKWKPTAGVFKQELEKGSESNITPDKERESKDKTETDDKVNKLKQFRNKGDN